MRKNIVAAIISLPFIFLSCAAGVKGVKEPASDNSLLVFGNIIFENKYYNNQLELIRKDINVAIVGKHDKDGKDHNYWVTTDKNGFFYLANVPKGKYAIQGFQIYLGQGELLTIANPLKRSGSYYQIQRDEYVVFQADYFPIETDSRIYNLKYNHFWIDQSTKASAQVEHRIYDKLDNLQLIGGTILKSPRVEQHFIDQHPTSGWVPLLKAELE